MVTHCTLRLVGGSYSIDQHWHDQPEELKQLHDYLKINEWTITKIQLSRCCGDDTLTLFKFEKTKMAQGSSL